MKKRKPKKTENQNDTKQKKLREEIEAEVKKTKSKEKLRIRKIGERKKIIILTGILLGMITVIISLFLNRKLAVSFAGFFVVVGLFFLFFYFRAKLKESARIKKIEGVFPDFLQLMGSNLRAGMTIDRAMLLSSREEFTPLDKEILGTGKDIATGKNIETALIDMSKRIGSEKINKTILLILSGIRAGGDLAVLLEETAVNIRERGFVEKRAASSVTMYVIFIFLAVSIGAPILFSLSSILVETLTNLLSSFPDIQTSTQMGVPFTLSSISISISFIKYFCLIFIITLDILASLILGLVNKGEEKEGLKYLLPLLIISLSIFFAIRFALSGFVTSLFV